MCQQTRRRQVNFILLSQLVPSPHFMWILYHLYECKCTKCPECRKTYNSCGGPWHETMCFIFLLPFFFVCILSLVISSRCSKYFFFFLRRKRGKKSCSCEVSTSDVDNFVWVEFATLFFFGGRTSLDFKYVAVIKGAGPEMR